jgi:hypothetical protein
VTEIAAKAEARARTTGRAFVEIMRETAQCVH